MPSFEQFVPHRRFQPHLAVSPDGTTVACSTNTDGQFHLWLLPLDGGPPRRLTDGDDQAVRAFAWSPDGTRIAYTADRDGDEQHQVHVLDVASGEVIRLTTAGDRQHHLADAPFDPSGRWLAYAGNDRDESVQDVLVHDLETGRVRRIASEPGLLAFPVAFGPDGRRLLVTLFRTNTDQDVAVVDLDDDQATFVLLTEHDGDAMHDAVAWLPDGSGCWLLTDAGGEFTRLATCTLDGAVVDVHAPDHDVAEAHATPDGRLLVWTVNEPAGHTPHLVQRAEDAGPRRVPVTVGTLAPLVPTPDGTRLVGLAASGARPTDVVTIDLDADGTEARLAHLTDSRPPALAEVTPVEPELITFPTHDGRDVPAWWYRPPGDGPHGVVLSVHGGPEAQERSAYYYAGLYQHLLANGIGVLAPNVRGSTGYGITYQKLIHRDWGGDELGDLAHAVAHLRSLDEVDPHRIAVFGGSFGGFAALSCVSRLPELFAAGVSIVGVSNLATFVRSVPPTWRPLMASWVGDPDDDAELLRERSPITYVDDIVAPLHIVQGAKDPRVVKAESDQIVEALRARGVEVRYDVYDDEGHGFTRRDNEIDAIGNVADFLIRHVG